jgi:hypothetical protein
MKRLIFFAIDLSVESVTAAMAQDVRYNFAEGEDFSKYKTYKWAEVEGVDHTDQLTEKQIIAAIDSELATKGLQKTDSDTGDLYIDIQTAIGTEKQFTSYNTGWGYGPGWGGGWYGYGGGNELKHDLWINLHDICGTTGHRHVRLHQKGVGLARSREQNNRSQGQT